MRKRIGTFFFDKIRLILNLKVKSTIGSQQFKFSD